MFTFCEIASQQLLYDRQTKGGAYIKVIEKCCLNQCRGEPYVRPLTETEIKPIFSIKNKKEDMMPYLNIKTNQEIKSESIISEISSFMAGLLNKPERVMMVSLSTNIPMLFAGTSTPTAFIQLKSIGLSAQQSKEIAPKMNSFFGSILNIPEDRIYMDMQDIDRKMFAFNGNTFA